MFGTSALARADPGRYKFRICAGRNLPIPTPAASELKKRSCRWGRLIGRGGSRWNIEKTFYGWRLGW